MKATYTHRILKDENGNPETHTIGGVKDLAQAWSLLDFAARRKGWNPAMANEDVKVSIQDCHKASDRAAKELN